MKQPDLKKSREAMVKEFNNNTERNHWKVVPIKEFLTGTRVLDDIWSMKRKRDILSESVTKFISRLVVHGGKQYYGVNNTEIYAPVESWYTILTILTLE